MGVLTNFDIDNNFWDINPGFKILGKFATLHKKDRTKGKIRSSTIMWAVAWFADIDSENRLKNFSEVDRKKLIAADLIGDKDFKWKECEPLIEFYRDTQMSLSKKSLIFLRGKMDEREQFLKSVTYNIDNARELDGILANTDKIFSMISRLELQIEKEESLDGGAVRGGRVESAGERKEI